MEMPGLRIDAKLAGPPPALSQSLWRRYRGKPYHLVRVLPRSRTPRIVELALLLVGANEPSLFLLYCFVKIPVEVKKHEWMAVTLLCRSRRRIC